MSRARLADALLDLDREAVLRTFLAEDGSIPTMPSKLTKRLLVLDHVAQAFAPGERCAETEVNSRLRAFHPDVAMLRRYLVDEGFLAREDGVYWRCGGTVPAS
ncbi:MAG TPA: DUF2087 domain-containing protein [Segeticoccus sp.]|uniref:DUF2087 domain-containing protein n=1 Tax=Segeticoccus sp. TaxID=2706531 RepID=UPI002D80D45A|nr:DUF2087 domain-containing protein [Segeticoccus sp.]HET8599238.1 DUF2087 domain-containing protein [Segeticoccus sp.]